MGPTPRTERRRKDCAPFLPDDLLAQLCDFIGLIGTAEYCARRVQE